MLTAKPDLSLTLSGSQDGLSRYYYGPRDTLVISGGSDRGVQIGQEYFVRRVTAPPTAYAVPRPIVVTTGWIRIVAVDREASIATVVRACDGMQQGDFLELVSWPELPLAAALGEPDYTDTGMVVFAPDGRFYAAAGLYVIIDLGTSRGLAVGQRLTLFRSAFGDRGPVTELAQAIAVTVAPDHATIRLTQSRDAVEIGDRVAPHR